MGLMVNQPTIETCSQEVIDLHEREKKVVFDGLKERSVMLTDALNSNDHITCTDIEGAMYAFPRLHFPQKFVDKCKAKGKAADGAYCFALLEETGIMVVPGSGFEQVDGTHHFRITNLIADNVKLNDALQ